MEPMFHSYQGFYLHTEAITYLMIVASLIGIAWFWNFLSGIDNDKNGNDFQRNSGKCYMIPHYIWRWPSSGSV